AEAAAETAPAAAAAAAETAPAAELPPPGPVAPAQQGTSTAAGQLADAPTDKATP
ncbi:rod shape-determining protein MreC, partial [Cryobacterium zongtaii]